MTHVRCLCRLCTSLAYDSLHARLSPLPFLKRKLQTCASVYACAVECQPRGQARTREFSVLVSPRAAKRLDRRRPAVGRAATDNRAAQGWGQVERIRQCGRPVRRVCRVQLHCKEGDCAATPCMGRRARREEECTPHATRRWSVTTARATGRDEGRCVCAASDRGRACPRRRPRLAGSGRAESASGRMRWPSQPERVGRARCAGAPA